MKRATVPVALALAALTGCGQAPAGAGGGGMPPPPPVGVACPVSAILPTTRDFTGRIEAIQMVEVQTLVGGIITKVLVGDGALVKQGDQLFQIDEAPLNAALAQAKAEVARADARLRLAGQQFARTKKLLAEGIVADQAFDDADAGQAAAVAEQAAAAAALAKAELDLGNAHIAAPISGRFGRVLATVGNLAQASGPAPGTKLGTIVAIDPVYAVADLDETLWRRIGARLRASADHQGAGAQAVKVQVALAGEEGFPHSGIVTFVDNQIDSASGTIRLRATLPNPDGTLSPGAFARIRLEVEAPRPVLLINEKAVQAQLTTRYVLIVDEQGGTAFRPVQLGDTVGAMRVVLGGLAPTDRIAVNNLAKIFFPGMPVVPVPAAMETTENLGPAPAAGAATPAATASAATASGAVSATPSASASSSATQGAGL